MLFRSKRARSASPEAIRLLQRYSWPGNVRELQGAIKNALVNATDEVITPECLPGNIQHGATLTRQIATAATNDELNVVALVQRLLSDGESDIYHQVQVALDGAVLDEVMRHVKGNQVEAARRLGISRTTLRAKLQAFGKLSGQTASPETEQAEIGRAHV